MMLCEASVPIGEGAGYENIGILDNQEECHSDNELSGYGFSVRVTKSHTCLGGSKSRHPKEVVLVGILGVDDVDLGVEGVDFEDVVDGVEDVVIWEDTGVEGVGVEGVDGQDQLKTWIWQSMEQFT